MSRSKLLWGIPIGVVAVILIVWLAVLPNQTQEPEEQPAAPEEVAMAVFDEDTDGEAPASLIPGERRHDEDGADIDTGANEEDLPELDQARKDYRPQDMKVLPPKAQAQRRRSLSDTQFYAVIDGWRGVETCMARHGVSGRAGRGAIRMAFTIAPSGSVTDTRAYETRGHIAEQMKQCVEQTAKTLRFPRVASGEPVEKHATFVF